MYNKELRDELAECAPNAILFDNPAFDNSIVGISTDGAAVYNLELMVVELAKEDNISEEEAMEFIDYNTIRSIPYAKGMFSDSDPDAMPPVVIETTLIEDYITKN